MALLGRKRIQGLGCYSGVVLQQCSPVSLELRDCFLAVLEGCQLPLRCGAGLFQLRQGRVQLRLGHATSCGELQVPAALGVNLGQFVEPHLRLALRIAVSSALLQLDHPLEVLVELLGVLHQVGDELPHTPLDLFGAVCGAQALG
jgi:hypothetical protein